ncbi:AmmeMemoRadiSam system radical SAM enzyme [candidate division KSB1 bacterium]|nr:AmmeMemoRadiSam system radical SAM enzyme [candidate division KSB1 bacterium]
MFCQNQTRRKFLKSSAALCTLVPGAAAGGLALGSNAFPESADLLLTEARHYEKLPHKKIRCLLCPRECVIDDLERGYCGVRENRGGTYYTLVHSRPCSAHIDPIEKKPLFHFLPGSLAFSIATVGCNVECIFCQNWEISQMRPEQAQNYDMPPAKVAQLASANNCASIAYTYTEPVIFEEYMYDCAVEGRKKNVRSVMISNGYINPKPLLELCETLDAVKIDLKAFTQKFYTELVSGELKPVLDTLELLVKQKMWLEIVYLVIPTKNDDKGELREMCQWIASDLNPDVPVHFSRFYPQYRLKNLSPTPQKTLRTAREIALSEGLHYTYIGNMPGDEGENTFCPGCKEVVVRRIGYQVVQNNIHNGACSKCGTKIAGIWR